MDITRLITLVYPVEAFVFGAEWLLKRAAQAPAAGASGRSNLCMKYFINSFSVDILVSKVLIELYMHTV